MKLSGTELAAMSDAELGPLVKGRAGWLLTGKAHGWSTNTVEALARKGLLSIAYGPGSKGVATINHETWRKVLLA